MTTPPTGDRPRVEGDREQEILDATLEVLADVGYDRLTMDAVATRAKASQGHALPPLEQQADPGHRRPAVARRRHPSRPTPAPCAATCCGVLRLRRAHRRARPSAASPASSPRSAATRSSPRLPHARSSAPKVAQSMAIFERARDRGELRDDVDIALLAPALAGIVLHRVLMLGEPPTPTSSTASSTRSSCPPAARRELTPAHTRRNPHDQHRPRHRSRTRRHPRASSHLTLGPRAHLHRAADGRARRHHRQHRAALHPADLDISQANLPWIVTGYALAFGGLLLLGGRLGDLYGRRRVFMIGLRHLRGRLAPRRPRAQRGAAARAPVACRASVPRSPPPPRSP